jgi:hypothetical protein
LERRSMCDENIVARCQLTAREPNVRPAQLLANRHLCRDRAPVSDEVCRDRLAQLVIHCRRCAAYSRSLFKVTSLVTEQGWFLAPLSTYRAAILRLVITIPDKHPVNALSCRTNHPTFSAPPMSTSGCVASSMRYSYRFPCSSALSARSCSRSYRGT